MILLARNVAHFMDFIHRPYQAGDTIAAIATPPGEGGVAIIRISGKDALAVAAQIYSGPLRSYPSHTAHCGKILDSKGSVVDQVLILPMLAPRSYTGEDTVEIHCHGGSLITRRVLETVLQAGARLAQPGEFTLKAFLNGKIDLSQAEAVQELIGAKNELALGFAEQQLEGRLSQHILGFQKKLTDLAAILEAWVDFPEEDLEFASMQEIVDALTSLTREMEKLRDTFHQGKIVHHGLCLCLVGLPNVGKSSLMNALLGKDRAIVTDVPGTTRDLLEEELLLAGLHFRLIDTAGMRDTEEIVEKEGIRRSKEAMERADLILLVMDITQELGQEAYALLHAAPLQKTIVVWNKGDLCMTRPYIAPFPHQVTISAKHAIGLEELLHQIGQIIWEKGPPSQEEVVITKARHQEALSSAIHSLRTLIEGLHTGVSAEFVASDMRHALSSLGTILGTNITEDILSAIFSKFCIGK